MPRVIHFRNRPLPRTAAAGVAYFGVVLAAGFLLGTLRVLVMVPAIGEAGAVGLELPIMLTLSWLACRWLIARFDVAAALTPRLGMAGLRSQY